MNFPKETAENLQWRVKMLRRCSSDPVFRQKMKELFHRDILFAFNAFFYTYDPRKTPQHHIPFMTWPYEDDLILRLSKQIKGGVDVLLEKSRDMGCTWCVLLTFLYFWLDPNGGYDFLCGSRIEDYVDKSGDPRTHFWRLRYTLYRLPKWLRPKGFSRLKHDNHMRLINPETGAAITGESNNPNFSTQGRYKGILFDEFAKWEATDEQAWTAAGDATPCRIALSTPFGAGGQYYNLAHDGKTPKITLHWSLHPEKALGLSCKWPPPNEADKIKLGENWTPDEKLTSPWYEAQIGRRSPKEVAQELDIDYLGAGSPVFDGKPGESLRLYHKLPDEPEAFYFLDLDRMAMDPLQDTPLNPEGYFIVYEQFSSKDTYAMGVDVVEGIEDGDYAFVTVLNRRSKNVVGVYWSQVDEILLAKVIKLISDYFSPEPLSEDAPWCGIETNGPGLATFDICVAMGVVNLFMAPRYDVSKGGVSYKKGWRTDTTSRNELIGGLKNYLIDRAGKINSQRIVGELLTMVHSKTGKPQAKSGCHDDAVMSFGIAIQVDEIAPYDYEAPKEKRQQFLEDILNPQKRNDDELKLKEPTTPYERCLLQELAKRDPFLQQRLEEEMFYNA